MRRYPERVTDPNSKLTCYSIDERFGAVDRVQQVINGNQTDCTLGSLDEVTSYGYDDFGRLLSVTRPKGNQVLLSYDTVGRLSKTCERDAADTGTCGTGAQCNCSLYTYGGGGEVEGRITKIELQDSSGVTKRTQELAYNPDRRLHYVKNPVGGGNKEILYDDDGVPAELRPEGGFPAIQYDVDALNRQTALRRTKTGGSDQWTVTPGVQLDLPTRVNDPTAKNLDYKWDDLNRKVTETSPNSGTTHFVYDEANNLVTKQVHTVGSLDAKTTTYTYDLQNRLLTIDDGDAACAGGGGVETTYVYDANKSCSNDGTRACTIDADCVSPGTCSGTGSNLCGTPGCNLLGQLAFAKTKIMCDGSSDKQFNQMTSYGYTPNGRVAQHKVTDDSTRVGTTTYTYNLGTLTRIDYPSGTTAGAVYTYGSSAASDDERVTAIARDTTQVIEAVQWMPGGPFSSYTQENGYTHNQVFAKIAVNAALNAAYRMQTINTSTAAGDNIQLMTFAEDAQGRYTQRVPTNDTPAGNDSYFLYDDIGRLSCRSASSYNSCPTTGTDATIENITYNQSGDRSSYIVANVLNTAWTTYTTNFNTGQNTFSSLSQTGGYTINYSWDTRGNRTGEDSTQYVAPADDQRVFTYDSRDRLSTVSGNFAHSDGTNHAFTDTYAYDEKNRVIFSSFVDTTASTTQQYWVYWDQFDREIGVVFTSGTFTVTEDFYWLGSQPIMINLIYSTGGGNRRFYQGDEQGRPYRMTEWPMDGTDASVAWVGEIGGFGWDNCIGGNCGTTFPGFRFPGMFCDQQPAINLWVGGVQTKTRADLCHDIRAGRTYDPFTGTYLQSGLPTIGTGIASAYGRAWQNPVDAPAGTVQPRSLKYDGETIFRGVFFGSGPVAGLISEAIDPRMRALYLQNAAELNGMAEVAIARITSEDPLFFSRFAQDVQSGNRSRISRALSEAAEFIPDAMGGGPVSCGPGGMLPCGSCPGTETCKAPPKKKKHWDPSIIDTNPGKETYLAIVVAVFIFIGAAFIVYWPGASPGNGSLQGEEIVDSLATNLRLGP